MQSFVLAQLNGFITNNSSKQSFVYSQLNDRTVLCYVKQFVSNLFGISWNIKQFYLTHRQDPIRWLHSRSEWNWKQWQWRGTSNSPNLYHYWSFTIRSFNVKSRTLVGFFFDLCRNAVGVSAVYILYKNTWNNICVHKQIIIIEYIYIYHHHHHHVVPLARISLTLSRHFSLSINPSGRSSGLHPVSSHSCWMYVRAARPAFAGHMWGS